jgi:hypothetical protein
MTQSRKVWILAGVLAAWMVTSLIMDDRKPAARQDTSRDAEIIAAQFVKRAQPGRRLSPIAGDIRRSGSTFEVPFGDASGSRVYVTIEYTGSGEWKLVNIQ